MGVYERILKLLLEESQKIGVPDEDMIKDGLMLQNDSGHKYKIEKVIKDASGKNKYVIASAGHKEVLTYEQLKKMYVRS